MQHFLASVVVLGFVPLVSAQENLKPAPLTPGAKQEIAQRRKLMAELNPILASTFAKVDDKIWADPKVQRAIQDLNVALYSLDPHVYEEAVNDWINGYYRNLPEKITLALLVPCFKKPEAGLERVRAQGNLMEFFAREFGPKGRVALPDLLAIVRDDKVNTYLRGQAIHASALIGPGDPQVVKIFVEALENPNPKNESGVHNRLARHLGDMGPAARPAKKALENLLAHRWYQDDAFNALGLIFLDPNLTLQDCLARLGKIGKIPVEEAAAAFIHIQKTGNPSSAVRNSNTFLSVSLHQVNLKVAEPARLVLLQVAEEQVDDMYARAALRTLHAIGPGASPHAARLLVRNLFLEPLRAQHVRLDTESALAMFEAKDSEAAKIFCDAFAKVAQGPDRSTRLHLAHVLVRYGKLAHPAAPGLILALEKYPGNPNPNPDHLPDFFVLVDALIGLGPEPAATNTILNLLAPNSNLLKPSGSNAPVYKAKLLTTLGQLGFPKEKADRAAVLDQVRQGLQSDLPGLYTAAAEAIALDKSLSQKESDTMVPLLLRVLSPQFSFQKTKKANDSDTARAGQSSVMALAALGPKAKQALPTLEKIAKMPLPESPSFTPEPAFNGVIRAARKAVPMIKGIP